MLRDRGLRLVYMTSSPVAPGIVEYYLSLLPQAVRGDARARLDVCSPPATGRRAPLTEKLLERPHLLTQIRWCARPCEHAVLLPYMTTPLERDLALALDMPLYGADPRHLHHRHEERRPGAVREGRRSASAGSRPHHRHARRDRGARAAARGEDRTSLEAIVKLDDAVSGEGNAVVDLRGLPRPGADGELRRASRSASRA